MDDSGIPIYLDEQERRLIDALSSDDIPHNLYPSNLPAQKLHRCVEAMRDLLPLVESIADTKAADKRRRKLKLLFTPLYSFVEALLHLMHDVQTNPDTKRGLPPGTDALVSRMETMLSNCVPHQKRELLRKLRNQMSSHIDPSLDPFAARDLFRKANPSAIGRWMDATVTVLADLLKLPIYIWSCGSEQANVFGLTAIGAPVITFFETDGKHPTRIAGVFLLKHDPRTEVFELLKALVGASRWMFKANDPQISGFKQDGKTDSWAQSLITLKKMKRLPTTASTPTNEPADGGSI